MTDRERPTRKKRAEGEGFGSTKRSDAPRQKKERPRPVPRSERVPTFSARESVMNCLARREHSQKELRDKLRLQNHAPEAIDEALSYMAEMGYQSDTRYAAFLVRYKGARQGERRLRQSLTMQKIDKETIEAALEQGESELTRAVTTLRRFEGKEPDMALRQRATRFMAGRGFGFDTIKKAWKVVFEGVDLDEFA
jgi:regulatory protein